MRDAVNERDEDLALMRQQDLEVILKALRATVEELDGEGSGRAERT